MKYDYKNRWREYKVNRAHLYFYCSIEFTRSVNRLFTSTVPSKQETSSTDNRSTLPLTVRSKFQHIFKVTWRIDDKDSD